ncbi:cDENN domain-containing protein [Dioscorea alata]|uniref:CDENN domain-containing protein n=4 Tax=Dioscorea alata TaxID=55571 RepID=A0ACB7U8R1_DIOAL|nr:cDENN domain-containing protein [Dioscorea alata]KAH7656662.1 cDENN domain-containing protein [Dioscorea alata]KAH7656672.1 cDENN domain-containing protein [Dioscorea alata]KAH7656673.1 cDENN domain-containing protein [Dioscorea alata]
MDKNEESGISSLFIQTTEDVANAVATAASATAVRSPRPSVVFSSRDDSGNNQLQKLQRRVISVLKGFSPPPEVKKATYNPEILTSQKRQWANFQLQTLDQRSVKEPSKLFESIVVVGLHPRTDVRALEKHVLERSNEDQKKSRSMLNFHQQVHAEPNFEPQILFVYPPKKKLPLKYKDLLSFCFPGGLEVHAVERTPSLSELNEILLGQEQVKQSDLSFVFRLQVADDSSLYGCCVYIEEIVQKPSGLISMLSEEQGTCFPLSRYVITTPRCYCILSRLPFFDLHFGILRSIFSEERYERLTSGIEMLNLLSSEENYGQDRTDDEPKSTEQDQSSADDRGQVEFSNIDIEAPREKISGNGNPPVSCEPEEELDSQETLKSSTALDVGKEAGDVTDGDTEISLQNGHKDPSGETTKREHFEKQFPVALLPLLQYHQCESPESHMRCGFYSSEDKNFRCEMDDLEPEEPSSSGQEDCTKHDSILEWAKANNHGSLQIICEYYKLQCPTRGSMITFQPLEHLHPLEFQRPAETVLHIAGSTVDLRSQNASLKLAESALLAEEEATALSVWTVACICGSLRLENVLALFSGALLEKQIVVVCSNLGILSASVLSIVPLIRPYQWQSLLMPVLPIYMMDFLDAPVPYIVGIKNKTSELQSKLSNVILVDVNKNQVKSTSMPQLPQHKELFSALSPYHARLVGESYLARKRPVYDCTDVQVEAAKGFLAVLRSYLDSLCSNLRSHTITNVQSNDDKVSLLLKESFIDSFPSRDRPFMKLFVDTQLFSVHTDLVLSFYQKD